MVLQVPLIGVGQPVNESVLSFAISSWSEIAYHDPSLTQYQFKIAEDLIYDIGNDTFAGRSSWQVPWLPIKPAPQRAKALWPCAAGTQSDLRHEQGMKTCWCPLHC